MLHIHIHIIIHHFFVVSHSVCVYPHSATIFPIYIYIHILLVYNIGSLSDIADIHSVRDFSIHMPFRHHFSL